MSCGIAVACSNTSSLQEVAGEAAVYFDPADPDEIAMTLTQVLEDNSLQESIRERGLERARQYSWQKTARQTVAVYRAVGSGKSSSASL
jgi:glycosyltransferase involved in cell wall biosynthesis